MQHQVFSSCLQCSCRRLRSFGSAYMGGCRASFVGAGYLGTHGRIAPLPQFQSPGPLH